ncbi:hypothetical protein OEV98_15300 [Caldibacillus lycopersici]|uniref:Uncharacterized protein n=1 Tax=Perspicuibacillus lycopersici TaxID=1325689 RepID=A0AAE3IZH3_9BACI|nr:hypothetical protein [Perspicuibacillus lycopersici]MCU9614910.1 hypothetical protein [Perspicuibacillus lycopersici]
MSIVIFASFAWLIMILFVYMPKWLTIAEMIFLYFIVGIMTVTLFTILDVNLHWVPVTRKVEQSLALHLCRFIIIPFPVIMAASIFNSPLNIRRKWMIVALLVFVLLVGDWLMQKFELIFFRHWSMVYSIFMYPAFIFLLSMISRLYRRLDGGGIKQS